MQNRVRVAASFLAATMCFFLTGCFESSVVVKVNKDGSGIIHQRDYKNAQGAMDALGGLGGGAGGEGDAVKMEPTGPTEEEMQELAKSMGDGVTLKTFKKNKNKAGWSGHEAVFAFEDVNKIKVEMNKPDPASAAGPAGGGKEKKKEFITFQMTDGVLSITPPEVGKGKKKKKDKAAGGDAVDGGANNPFGGADGGGAEMMAMMAPMMAGAKVGFFIQAGDEIAETNAKHQKGSLITLLKMDIAKIITNTEMMGKMEDVEGDRKAMQELADSADGVDIDFQETITIKFK